MASVRCPTCEKQFDPADSLAMPFCSERCRKIDLGRWLSEEISMPLDELSEDPGPRRRPPDEDND